MWHGTYTSSCLDWGKAVHTDSYCSCVSFQLLQETLVVQNLQTTQQPPSNHYESGRHRISPVLSFKRIISNFRCSRGYPATKNTHINININIYYIFIYIPMEKESHHHHSLEETRWLGFMWYTGSLPPRRNDRVPLRLACHNDSTPQEVWVHRKTHLNGAVSPEPPGPSTHTIR